MFGSFPPSPLVGLRLQSLLGPREPTLLWNHYTQNPSQEPDWRSMRVQFPAMTNLTSALRQLEQERDSLATRLQQLNTAISALTGVRPNSRGPISAAGRARIAAAQRARWARAKGEKVVSIASRRRRKLSSAAIARIRAAQKARWAKWRKTQRTA